MFQFIWSLWTLDNRCVIYDHREPDLEEKVRVTGDGKGLCAVTSAGGWFMGPV